MGAVTRKFILFEAFLFHLDTVMWIWIKNFNDQMKLFKIR